MDTNTVLPAQQSPISPPFNPADTHRPPISPPPSSEPKKWYQNTLGIIILVLFFFPVGIFLMWKYAHWNKIIKILITLFYVVFILVVFTPASSDTQSKSSTSKSSGSSLTNKPTINVLTIELSEADKMFIASRSALLKQFLSDSENVDKDFQVKSSTSQLVTDINSTLKSWGTLLAGQWANDPPSDFKDYDTLLFLATDLAHQGLTLASCSGTNGDASGVSKGENQYKEAINYIKNTQAIPKGNYENQLSKLRDETNDQSSRSCTIPLKADIRYTPLQLLITNNDNFQWTSCTASIGDYGAGGQDEYISDTFILQPHQTEKIGWANFTLLDGTRFNHFATKAQGMDLECTVNGIPAKITFEE